MVSKLDKILKTAMYIGFLSCMAGIILKDKPLALYGAGVFMAGGVAQPVTDIYQLRKKEMERLYSESSSKLI